MNVYWLIAICFVSLTMFAGYALFIMSKIVMSKTDYIEVEEETKS